jgi:hypothetical protein
MSDEFYTLYYSSHIITTITLRTRWTGHAACTAGMKNKCTVSDGNVKGRDHIADLGTQMKIN